MLKKEIIHKPEATKSNISREVKRFMLEPGAYLYKLKEISLSMWFLPTFHKTFI